jgi:hypothetical protein
MKFRKHGEITDAQELDDDTPEVPKHAGYFVFIVFKYQGMYGWSDELNF